MQQQVGGLGRVEPALAASVNGLTRNSAVSSPSRISASRRETTRGLQAARRLQPRQSLVERPLVDHRAMPALRTLEREGA